MSWVTEYLLPIGLLVAVVAVLSAVMWYTQPPFTGALLIEDLSRVTDTTHIWSSTQATDQRALSDVVMGRLVRDVSRAPDGAYAFLLKKGSDWQVVLRDADGERMLTSTRTLKRDLVWAPNGLSLAFSEFDPRATSSSPGNPDSWTVVRMVRSGDAFYVGSGVHPIPVDGAETLALTSRGIVRMRPGVPPELLVASPVRIVDTPLAATEDGALIAWVSPTDAEIQVFAQTAARTYVPLTRTGARASSLHFADSTTVLATVGAPEATDIVHIAIPEGTVTVLGSTEGRVTITDAYDL